MKQTTIMALMLFCTFGLFSFGSQEGTITLSGTGSISMTPDTLKLVAVIEKEASSPDQAIALAQEAYNQVLNELNMVEKKNIKTTALQVYPKRDREGEITAHIASQSLEISTGDLTLAPALARGVLQLGASRIEQLLFSVANPESFYDQARVLAVENAKTKALILAKTAGRNLGKALEIREESSFFPQANRSSMLMEASSFAPINPEDQNLSYKVTITFELVD